MEKAKEILELLIKSIVSVPDSVIVVTKTDEMGVLLTLSVAKEDMGLVIGKGGNMANAIRLFMHAVGLKERAKIAMKILEPEEIKL